MEKLLWTRCDWLAWEWHHPWTFAIPAALVVGYGIYRLTTKDR